MIDLSAIGSVIVQGMTGSHGAMHTERMIAYGTPIVAGVTPGKGGQDLYDRPIYDKVSDAVDAHGKIDASVIFVPAKAAKGAAIEAINAGIPLVVIITEGIPVHDMLQISQHSKKQGSTVVGPNGPGLMMPGLYTLGIIPTEIAAPGDVAIVSRSGTLTYEAIDGLSRRGIGQHTIVGIGGDRISGSSFVDWLEYFEHAAEVKKIVMIGEIGGKAEISAAKYISTMTKPVYAYVAGHSAPPGVQMGHAGALLGGDHESAKAKTEQLHRSGAQTADSLSELLDMIA